MLKSLASLARRLDSAAPKCVVCGKRLSVARVRRLPVAGPFSVLTCPEHEVVAGYALDGLKTLARKATQRWLPKGTA